MSSYELYWAIPLFGALGYALGSIPFGLILTRRAGLGDIRAVGSGNIGATNVLRTGHKKLAACTLLLDAAKGVAAVALARLFTSPEMTMAAQPVPGLAAYAAGLGALLGHIYSFWLKGKGGKGVATYFGMLLALSWPVFLITAINWLVMFRLKRISSLAALFAIAFAPLWMWVFTNLHGCLAALIFSLLVAARHRDNILRLLRGEEKPFAATPAAQEPEA